jgi:hypothetical protein
MKILSLIRPAAVCAIAAAAVACSNSSPSSPSSSTATTASVTSPLPTQPANNASIPNSQQPVTLTVKNAVVTQSASNTYTFEVASDAAFASKVQTKDSVAETSGQTSVKLDTLAAAKDYYWRARATGGGTTGPYTAAYKFSIGPAVTIDAPIVIGPLNGAQTLPRPALRVRNVTRTGPAGPITYKFEVSNSATFSSTLVSATQAEGVNETGFIPTSDLPIGPTLFWRATAIDATNGVSSAPSAVQTFTTRAPSQAEVIATQLGQALWPGAQPPGTLGHATMGNDPAFGQGWQIQTLYYAPQNVFFQSPDLEMLRFFDLFDRGFDPDSAIAWMNSNGYPTNAQWYPPPEKAVLGLHYVYLASRNKVFTNGTWDIVLRLE